MSDQDLPEAASGDASREEMMTALFAQLIMQQTNMAMMFLGKVSHPETGQTYKDVEAARLFIDQLEMLEAKTKGNLTKEETGLLKQSLMNLRLAFVEAADAPQPARGAAPVKETPGPAQPKAADSNPPSAETPSAADDEHRKKFSKKY